MQSTNTKKKRRERKRLRYFECDSSTDVPTAVEDPGPGPVPETPEYYNGRQARLDIFTDNSYDNDPEPVLSGNITEIPPTPTDYSTNTIPRKVFTSRPPSAVLQCFNPLSKPAPPAIRSLLQRLKPITVNVLRPISRSYTEQQFLACMESTAPSPVPDTFDSDDLLKQFDQLQSNKPDIVAQAMELASIPTDMNNNSDILSKAMEMSDITSDIMMEL